MKLSFAFVLGWVVTLWLPITLCVFAAITLLSLWPLSDIPDFPGTDKTHHLIAYGALMLPVALRKPTYWLLLAVLFFAWSGAIELIQPYVNRYGEWSDLAANVTGLLLGAVSGTLFRKLL